MQFLIYELQPTDCFIGFTPGKEAIKEISKYGEAELDTLDYFINKAKYLIDKYTSWEGDGEIYISSIPSFDDSFPLIFVTIKQSNNGTTFLMSPVKLQRYEQFLKYASREDN